jgi:hypothetical protein
MPKTERRGGGVQQLDNNSARQSYLEKLWSERPLPPYSQSSVQFFSLYNTLIISFKERKNL